MLTVAPKQSHNTNRTPHDSLHDTDMDPGNQSRFNESLHPAGLGPGVDMRAEVIGIQNGLKAN